LHFLPSRYNWADPDISQQGDLILNLVFKGVPLSNALFLIKFGKISLLTCQYIASRGVL
jgi:hypothetical protein